MTENPDTKAETVETVPHGEHQDVVSDPALADNDGADWASEGGATVTGPATDTDNPDNDDAED